MYIPSVTVGRYADLPPSHLRSVRLSSVASPVSLLVLDFADGLGHGSHRAERAPCPGFVQRHDNQAYQGGGQHDAVETEAELGNPIGYRPGSISPAPGYPEQPEQFDRFLQRRCTGTHQIGLEYHIGEHNQEEDQEAIPKPLGRHPSGCGLVAEALAVATQLGKELTSAAEAVTESLIAANHSDEQRHQKIDHTQPSKQNVKESQREIEDRPDP